MNDGDNPSILLSNSLSGLSNPFLQVRNPAVIRPKDRPVEARGRRGARRQQEFDNSTQRESSQYEHVLTETEQQQEGQREGQRGRRGRGRGLTRARGQRGGGQRGGGQRGGGQRGGGQRGGEQRGERAATPPSIQTDAGLFAAFHM